MLELVKALDHAALAGALAETPSLLSIRDERGRTWLHIAVVGPRSLSIDFVDHCAACGVVA
jgi:hypothetical protein